MRGPETTDYGWHWKGELGWLTRWLHWEHSSLGVWGEWLALRHLRRLGWQIIARNWRLKWGEIDLIANDSGCLVFVEVKTRIFQPDSLFTPLDNFDLRKERQLERLAFSFMQRYELEDRNFRFDLIAIETIDRRSFELEHYLL